MENKLLNRCPNLCEVIEKVPNLTIQTVVKSQSFLCDPWFKMLYALAKSS